MRLAIRQGPEPCSKDIHIPDLFLVGEFAQAVAPFGGNNTGRMVGKSGENGNFVSSFGPVVGEFGGAGSRRTHLGREVLGDVKDFHANVEGTAKTIGTVSTRHIRLLKAVSALSMPL